MSKRTRGGEEDPSGLFWDKSLFFVIFICLFHWLCKFLLSKVPFSQGGDGADCHAVSRVSRFSRHWFTNQRITQFTWCSADCFLPEVYGDAKRDLMYERIYVMELKQNDGQDAGFMLTKILLVEPPKCEQLDLSDIGWRSMCQNYWQ